MNQAEVELYAQNLFKKSGEEDYLFAYELALYRARVTKNGNIKVKNICTGYPYLSDAVNKGSEASASWHYEFTVESKNFQKTKVLLSPNQLTSKYTFKKALLNKVHVMFTGSKGDFEMFISEEMENFDFSD